MDKLKPKLYHLPLQLQPLNLSALGYWKVLLRLSLNLSMAPAALYLKPIRSMGFSTEVKVGLGVGITAILVAIIAALLQLFSWRYPVVHAKTAPCADAVTSTSSVDGHESE